MNREIETGHIWRRGNIVSPFDVLKEAGGWYQCPKDFQGKRSGPLVGYAARDELDRQLVGEEYVNFAKIEEDVDVVHNLALLLGRKIPKSILSSCNVICGVPEGGKILAAMLALVCNKKFKYPDKKIIPSKISGERDESIFTFGKHKIGPSKKVILVEDVTSSFSSVKKILQELNKNKIHLTAIVTFFNRSIVWNDYYHPKPDEPYIPVISLIRKEIRQYRQDDPFVSDDVKKGNVVWDPKNNWEQLV
ncbi:MAG: phosphoribosyltransferase [Patescibacteria group bacterium]|nr:phosphoribosyltransferase [Patescibacteria group bacterium]MDE2218447.1 phosphoribosyltransferase [Patescibacteria group bacterium]